MDKEFFFYYKTNLPIEQLKIIGISSNEKFITNIFFSYEIDNIKNSNNYIFKETILIKKTWNQLEEYFNKKRTFFDIPISKNGTPFQNNVWNELEKIPYGETRSYKDIAKLIGNERASRAIGMANNKNKIPIIIPCHRVIGSNKKLIGYAGGLDVKTFLLNLEKKKMEK